MSLVRGFSNIFGLVLPIFYSYKVLKTPRNKELTESLQYWTVYGTLQLIDWFVTTFYISMLIPFYELFFLMLTVFIAFPKIGAAKAVYKKFLAPAIRKKERTLDQKVDQFMKFLWSYIPTLVLSVPDLATNAFTALANFDAKDEDDQCDGDNIQVFEEVQDDEDVIIESLGDSGFDLARVKREVIEEDEMIVENLSESFSPMFPRSLSRPQASSSQIMDVSPDTSLNRVRRTRQASVPAPPQLRTRQASRMSQPALDSLRDRSKSGERIAKRGRPRKSMNNK